jgi:hypothetical protein
MNKFKSKKGKKNECDDTFVLLPDCLNLLIAKNTIKFSYTRARTHIRSDLHLQHQQQELILE